MDYANMLGLSPTFGLGGQVNEDVAMQNAVAAPDTAQAASAQAASTKAPSFTNEQLGMLAKMGLGGQSPLYPAPGAPSARAPQIGALTQLPTPAPIARKRQGLGELLYGK